MVRGRPRFLGLFLSEMESLSDPEYLLFLLCRPSLALKLICSDKLRKNTLNNKELNHGLLLDMQKIYSDFAGGIWTCKLSNYTTGLPVWHSSSCVATNRFPLAPSASLPPPSFSSAPQEWYRPSYADYVQSQCLFPLLPSWRSWQPAQMRSAFFRAYLLKKNKLTWTPFLFRTLV